MNAEYVAAIGNNTQVRYEKSIDFSRGAIITPFGKPSGHPSNIDLTSPRIIGLFDVMVVVRN